MEKTSNLLKYILYYLKFNLLTARDGGLLHYFTTFGKKKCRKINRLIYDKSTPDKSTSLQEFWP